MMHWASLLYSPASVHIFIYSYVSPLHITNFVSSQSSVFVLSAGVSESGATHLFSVSLNLVQAKHFSRLRCPSAQSRNPLQFSQSGNISVLFPWHVTSHGGHESSHRRSPHSTSFGGRHCCSSRLNSLQEEHSSLVSVPSEHSKYLLQFSQSSKYTVPLVGQTISHGGQDSSHGLSPQETSSAGRHASFSRSNS